MQRKKEDPRVAVATNRIRHLLSARYAFSRDKARSKSNSTGDLYKLKKKDKDSEMRAKSDGRLPVVNLEEFTTEINSKDDTPSFGTITDFLENNSNALDVRHLDGLKRNQ